MSWHGVKKRDDETVEDYLDRLESHNEGVAEGLKKCLGITKKFKDWKGTCVVEVDGEERIMPVKSFKQMRYAGRDDVVFSHMICEICGEPTVVVCKDCKKPIHSKCLDEHECE